MPLKVHKGLKKQAGFTLIELMVVVVIVSVVTSISILSLGSSDQKKRLSQQNQIKTLLTFVRDQSTFDRKLYLVVPKKEGLTTYVFSDNVWKVSPKVDFLAWQPGLAFRWTVDDVFADKQQLPEAGWMAWPTGDVLEGEIVFWVGDWNTKPKKEDRVRVSWDGLLRFDSVTDTATQEGG